MQYTWWITSIVAICVLALVYIFIGHFSFHKPENKVPYIVCTTGIVADTVAQVAGDYATIDYLMGPGVDPHLYRARESDVHRLAAADLIFYNGLHLEGKMDEVFDRIQTYTKAVAVTRDIPQNRLRSAEFAQVYDPHVWFDVTLWQYTVDTIALELSKQFPEYAEIYRENAQTYQHRLARLDRDIRHMVERVPKQRRKLITAHDAFGYFARAYDFEVVGLQGISTDAQVGTYDIMHLADYIVTHRVPVIFIEASIPQRNIQAVQEAVAAYGFSLTVGDQLYSDTLGPSGSNAETYIDMVSYNVKTIVAALQSLP